MGPGCLGRVSIRAAEDDGCSATAAPLGASAGGQKSPNHTDSEKPTRAERARGASRRSLASACQYPSHVPYVSPHCPRSAPCVRSSGSNAVPHPLPASVSAFSRRACRATPTQSQAAEAPSPKKLHGLSPTRREGETKPQKTLSPLPEDTGAPPIVGGVGTEGVKSAGKPGTPGLGVDPGVYSLLAQSCSCFAGG